MAAPASTSEARIVRSRATLINRFKEGGVRNVCLLCAVVSVVVTVGIIWVLFSQSVPFFRTVSIGEFVTGTKWAPSSTPASYGIVPLVVGTLMVTLGAGLVAIPLGLLSAIYLSEYAPTKVRNILKPALELIAGVPSVVFGYFALFAITPLLRSIFGDGIQQFNAAAAAIVVGVMILPLVSSLCEDALSAVPRALREGAYGLGATKFEVCAKIVVPAAFSGVMASFILALSRALGETMAVTLAAGASPNLTLNPGESIQTMTAFIVTMARGDAASGQVRYHSMFAVGVALFVFTMALNLVALRLVRKFRQEYS